MTLEKIKEDLKNHLGQKVRIKYNLGRNKYEEYEACIKEIYSRVFLVELSENKSITKSFSYSDIISKTISLKY